MSSKVIVFKGEWDATEITTTAVKRFILLLFIDFEILLYTFAISFHWFCVIIARLTFDILSYLSDLPFQHSSIFKTFQFRMFLRRNA